ncbi:hypothetical protein D3C78_584040 [compost metagenome]
MCHASGHRNPNADQSGYPQHHRRCTAAQRHAAPGADRAGLQGAQLELPGPGPGSQPRGQSSAGAGPAAGRPGGGLRQELRRLPDSLAGLYPGRPDPCPGQFLADRARAGLYAQPVRCPGAVCRRLPAAPGRQGLRPAATGHPRQPAQRCAGRRAQRYSRGRLRRWLRPRTGGGGGRDRCGADSLYLRHHLRSQGRHAHPPLADGGVLQLPAALGHQGNRPLPGSVAALPFGADARVHHALAAGRCLQLPAGYAEPRGNSPPAEGQAAQQLLRPAHGVDRLAAPRAVRRSRAAASAQTLLRRLDHARAGGQGAGRAAAAVGPLQLLRAERDRPAGHRAVAL